MRLDSSPLTERGWAQGARSNADPATRYHRDVPQPDIRDYLQIRTAIPCNFSPDGETLLVRSDLSGTHQLYRASPPSGALGQVTGFAEPVTGAYLPTSGRILMSMDEGGNERHQIYLVDEDGANLQRRVYAPEFIHRTGGVARDGSAFAYASNRRNGIDFDVYLHRLDREDASLGANDRLLFAPGGWCQPTGFSPDGRSLGVMRLTEKPMDNELYLLDVSSGEAVPVADHEGDASLGPPRWLADGSAFYFACDVARDLQAIARYDVRSGSWEYVLERDWGLACSIDWAGRTLLVTENTDGYTTASLLDPSTLETCRELKLPQRGVASEWSFSRDGRWLAYAFTSPRQPPDGWMCDTESGASERLTQSPCGSDSDTLVEPTLSRFPSFDGEEIPVFTYLPDRDAAPSPVVAIIHGGPEGQARPSFNALVAYLVARGYAVVVPNVRGSTGYGKRYHHLDDRRKRLDAVRDLEALHDWLRASPDFDATRAALFGGSYGGYMVLSGLAFQPDRWAVGVDIVGVSNLATFLENTSPWRRKVREREYGTLEEDRDFLVGIAPATHVDNIRAPLFIIHGANDPRVPLSETAQMHAALKDRGVRCELLVYPDEGHGLAKLPNRLDAYPRAADFLDEVLGISS